MAEDYNSVPTRVVRSYRSVQGWRRGLVRNLEAGELLELFLVAAVAAVLAIRAFLAALGYPSLGGDGLHIAHMLWGGVFMLVAFILLFSFVGRGLGRLAAILAGIGFGTFIDELGKFITSDNDYFYKPTIGLIYIIFIVIFLILRTARRKRSIAPGDALANALTHVQDSISAPLDPQKKAETLALLDQADPDHPLYRHLRAYVQEAELSPDDPTNFYFRIKEWAFETYRRVATHRRFAVLFPALFLTWGIVQAGSLAYLAYGITGTTIEELRWTHYAQAASMAVTVACIAIGIVAWPSSRSRSYRWYMRGALVSIFITQVFVFFQSQLAAITGLSVNVLTYASLAFVANLEAEATAQPSIQQPANPS